ncbi:DUF4435 domain-containing protein [Myxococcus sp. AB036A]|uniref:DUF4435 domain-containing protein n=1 Tax=Myxococcus sp. AB036A TaxID=2562793 RepID=UPI001147046B|nr:DUF4435 domain-containing protein [Myxococcus sp. AB036A]
MNSTERRTIDELIARYELEPTLRDIYTEGEYDARIIQWLIKGLHLRHVSIYEIQSVEIDPGSIVALNLEDNNRGRLISLALALHDALGADAPQATMVVDGDFDCIFGHQYTPKNIIYTDYTSMEMYLFSEAVLGKFMHLACGITRCDIGKLIDSFSRILNPLFMVRRHNSISRLGFQRPDFATSLSTDESNLPEINFDHYLDRYLDKNKARGKRAEVLEYVRIELSKTRNLDTRLQSHGHDFIELLTWYVKNLGHVGKIGVDTLVSRGLLGCLELERVKGEHFFARILSRVSSAIGGVGGHEALQVVSELSE